MSVIDSKPLRLSALAVAAAGTIYGLVANGAPVRIWERPASSAERAEPPGPVTILPICASGWRCAADSGDLLWCSCQMPSRAPEPKPESSKVRIGPSETRCGPAGDGCNTSCCDESGFCNTTLMACTRGTEFFEVKP